MTPPYFSQQKTTLIKVFYLIVILSNQLLPAQAQQAALTRQNSHSRLSLMTQNKIIMNTPPESQNIHSQNLITVTAPRFMTHPPQDRNMNPFSKDSQRLQISNAQIAQAKKLKQLVNQSIDHLSPLAESQYDLYEQKYNISQYKELPFCLVVPTYNNAQNQRYLKNIKSIVSQNYTNYRLVIIDDASIDQTKELIQQFMKSQTKLAPNNYRIEKNEERLGALQNIRRAAQTFCKAEDIFVTIDGDDYLIGRQVLKVFNAIFSKQKAWFVYSVNIFGEGLIGYSRPIPEKIFNSNSYRRYPFITSHLRAFYTQLLRAVKEEDLKNSQGKYFAAANDVAICLPILEMAHPRIKFLPEITYYYSDRTGLNNHWLRAKEQKQNERLIRQRKEYSPLKQLF